MEEPQVRAYNRHPNTCPLYLPGRQEWVYVCEGLGAGMHLPGGQEKLQKRPGRLSSFPSAQSDESLLPWGELKGE